MSGKKSVVASLAAAVAVLAAGCGGAGAQGGAVSSSPATSSASGSAAPTPTTTVATKDVSYRGDEFQVQVYDLHRDGGLVRLEFGVQNPATTDTPTSDVAGAYYGTAFGRGSRADASGVALIDTKGKKKYLPALYNDECLCSKNMYGKEVRAGQTVYLRAAYAEVPDDVQNLDIQLASLGTITNVPIK